MKREIKTTLALDGEKAFKTEMSAAARQMRVLNSEMRLSTAAFAGQENSTEALTDKSKILNKQIDQQKEMIRALGNAVVQAAAKYGDADRRTDDYRIQLNNARAALNKMENELAQTEKSLDSFGDEMKDNEEKAGRLQNALSKIGSGLKSFAGVAGRAAVTGLKAVAGATAAAAAGVGAAVKSFSELEQNLGGSEAVFDSYAAQIQKLGEEAYINLGVSQSAYLATANKMGALFQGSGIEQQKSLELTEKAMQRAADMASVMGIDTQVALDSVAGAAKGNFTMMDNLGVAMNATNIEAYALAKGLDFTWAKATQAEKAEMAMQMFFENTQQYAGNFRRESTETISGSIGMLRAALASFTGGLGNANADITNLTENIVDALAAVVKNILPVVQNVLAAMPRVTGALLGAVGQILPGIVTAIADMLPQLVTTGTDVLAALVQAIVSAVPVVLPALTGGLLTLIDALIQTIMDQGPTLIKVALDAAGNLVTGLLEALPQIASAAIVIILALVNGLTEQLPSLIPAAVAAILTVAQALIDNLPLIIDVAILLILALVDGLLRAIPKILEAAPKLVQSLVNGLVRAIPMLVDAAILLITMLAEFIIDNLHILIPVALEIIGAIVAGLTRALPELLKILPKIWGALSAGIKRQDWLSIGKNIIGGIGEGLTKYASTLIKAAEDAVKGALSSVKNFLGIRSPSSVMRNQVGMQMGAGVAEGVLDSAGKVRAAMGKLSSELTTTARSSFALDVTTGAKAAGATAGRGDINITINGNINNRSDAIAMAEKVRRLIDDKERGRGLVTA